MDGATGNDIELVRPTFMLDVLFKFKFFVALGAAQRLHTLMGFFVRIQIAFCLEIFVTSVTVEHFRLSTLF